MRISEARQADRGLYVCVAENVAGRAQAAAILDVESKYRENDDKNERVRDRTRDCRRAKLYHQNTSNYIQTVKT